MKKAKSKVAKFFLKGKDLEKFTKLVDTKSVETRDKAYKKFMSNLSADTSRKSERPNKFDVLALLFKVVRPEIGVEYNLSDKVFCGGVSPLASRYINSKILKGLGMRFKGTKKAQKLDGSGESKKYSHFQFVAVKK